MKRQKHIEVFGEVGTRVLIDGQMYVRIEPTNGKSRDYAYWETHCVDCGAPMEVFAVPGRIDFSRRCRLHAKPGVRVR